MFATWSFGRLTFEHQDPLGIDWDIQSDRTFGRTFVRTAVFRFVQFWIRVYASGNLVPPFISTFHSLIRAFDSFDSDFLFLHPDIRSFVSELRFIHSDISSIKPFFRLLPLNFYALGQSIRMLAPSIRTFHCSIRTSDLSDSENSGVRYAPNSFLAAFAFRPGSTVEL